MIADHLGAGLSLLHIVPPTESDRVQGQALLRAGEQLKVRISPPWWQFSPPPSVYVRAGGPAQVVIGTMKELSSD